MKVGKTGQPRPLDDLQARGAQHGFDTGMVRGPPVRGISRQPVLDEGHPGPARLFHRAAVVDVHVRRRAVDLFAGRGQGLEDHPPRDPPGHDVEPQERIAEVVENAHEEDEVVLFVHARQVVHLHLAEAHPVLHPELPGGPARLLQIMGIVVDAGDERAAPREREGVEARVAADVEGRPPGEVFREMPPDLLPLEGREVPQEMVGDRLRAVGKMEVVEPGTQRCDFVREGGSHGARGVGQISPNRAQACLAVPGGR